MVGFAPPGREQERRGDRQRGREGARFRREKPPPVCEPSCRRARFVRHFRHERIRRYFCRGGGGSGWRAFVPGAAPCRRSLGRAASESGGRMSSAAARLSDAAAFRFFLRRHDGGARRARPAPGRRRGGCGGVLPYGHSRKRSSCRGAGLLASCARISVHGPSAGGVPRTRRAHPSAARSGVFGPEPFGRLTARTRTASRRLSGAFPGRGVLSTAAR